jgi:translation initiation factor 4G
LHTFSDFHIEALPLQVTANVAGGSAPLPPKAGDLSNFGKIQSTSKGLPMTFGPSSVFSGKKDTKHKSLSRSSSNQNTFSMLSQNPEAPAEAKGTVMFL